jgi:hypothetical protein
MGIRALGLSLAFLGLALLAPARGDLITNGSFEDGGFVPDGNDTMSLAPGATSMTGWTVVQAELAWIGPTNPFGIVASDGSFSLDLAGYHDSVPYGGVSQAIATNAGYTYHLSFDLGASTLASNPTSKVTAIAGGTSNSYSLTASNGLLWQTFGFDFTATGSSTVISLLGDNPNGNYVGLDNVHVTLVGVPEPTGLALLGLGLGGAFAALRRRRAA